MQSDRGRDVYVCDSLCWRCCCQCCCDAVADVLVDVVDVGVVFVVFVDVVVKQS